MLAIKKPKMGQKRPYKSTKVMTHKSNKRKETEECKYCSGCVENFCECPCHLGCAVKPANSAHIRSSLAVPIPPTMMEERWNKLEVTYNNVPNPFTEPLMLDTEQEQTVLSFIQDELTRERERAFRIVKNILLKTPEENKLLLKILSALSK